jgi:Rap1a immunity proteins
MSVRTILAGGAALALTVTGAAAEQQDTTSANTLLPGCRELLDRKSDSGGFLRGFCAGTVTEILAFGGMLHSVSDVFVIPRALCIDAPAAVAAGQAVRVVVAYIDARPARMHERFDRLAIEALRETWPCR